MSDKVSYDSQTGAKGLEGVRVVKNGKVKILGDLYGGVCLLGREGEKVLVRPVDCWALTYNVADVESGEILGEIK